jgi:hypothetical protein
MMDWKDVEVNVMPYFKILNCHSTGKTEEHHGEGHTG